MNNQWIKIQFGLSDGLIIGGSVGAFLVGVVTAPHTTIFILFWVMIAGAAFFAISSYFATHEEELISGASGERQKLKEECEREKTKTMLHFQTMQLPESMLQQAFQDIDDEAARWSSLSESLRQYNNFEKRAEPKSVHSLLVGLGFALGVFIISLPYLIIDDSATALIVSSLLAIFILFLTSLLSSISEAWLALLKALIALSASYFLGTLF